jgi:hypothetical protein
VTVRARRWARGVSSPDASLRDLENVLGREVKFYAIRTVTASFTFLDSDDVVIADATAGAVVATLPLAATHAGRRFTLKKSDAGANNVSFDGNGAETIDGAATKAWNTQYLGYTVQSDGTQWWTVP